MKIEIRKFKYYPKQSKQDWISFSADIYIDGIKAGTTSNDGRGGPTDIVVQSDCQPLISKAEAYCASLPHKEFQIPSGRKYSYPQTLENTVFQLALDEVNKKELAKFQAALDKDCANHICVGTDSKYWKYKLPYHVMVLATDKTQLGAQGPEYLIKRLTMIKAALKPGQRILNDNIPAEILNQVFPPEKSEAQ